MLQSPAKMHSYLGLLRDILENGTPRQDRTGVGTRAVFGRQLRFNLQEGFPLLTTKKVNFRGVAEELFWFLRGETNIRSLQEKGVKIWNEWADENGELGPVYGAQWRNWRGPNGTHDQIKSLVQGLKDSPHSRRHIVSAWNVGQLNEMALPPCHMAFQCFVAQGRLSLQLYQRSADIFLGVPFNIASYSLLVHLLAAELGLGVGEFVHTFGDAHLYDNHIEQAKLQLSREPRALPTLRIVCQRPLDQYTFEDIQIQNYDPHPHIAGVVAV